MKHGLQIRLGSEAGVASYLAAQLNATFPDAGIGADVDRLLPIIGPALARLEPMLERIRSFQIGVFDHLHSLQYCAFLYLVSNTYRNVSLSDGVADRVFGLNRMLNSIDLYHAIALPPVFFISHGLGSVLGNAVYGNRLVVFHNVTVGRVGEDRPRIGDDVVLYPGTTITGRCLIGDRCVIATGAHLHNESIPDDSIVFASDRGVTIRRRARDYAGLYFRPA